LIATRHTNTPVKKGQKLAGTGSSPRHRREATREAEAICRGEPSSTSFLYKLKTAGIVTTGNEVAKAASRYVYPCGGGKAAGIGIETTHRAMPATIWPHHPGRRGIPRSGRGSGPLHRRHEWTPTTAPRRHQATGGTRHLRVRPCCPAPCSCWAISPTACLSWLPAACVCRATIFDLILPRMRPGARLRERTSKRWTRGPLPELCRVPLSRLSPGKGSLTLDKHHR
jgi:hypothetical protein